METQDQQNALEFILSIINQYNAATAEAEAVQLIFPSSSAELAWVGKTVTVAKSKYSEIVTIPYALLPLSLLRKQYGLSPILEKNHKLKPVKVSKKGIEASLQLLDKISHRQQIQIDNLIVQTILGITASNYIRSLRKILLLTTNLMMLEEKPNNTQQYLDGLAEEYTFLKHKFNHDPMTIINLQRNFNQYISRIENILEGNSLPFAPNEKFRSEIMQRFPVLYCASMLTEKDTMVKDIKNLAVKLEDVKLIFTPDNKLSDLKSKLKEIGLDKIQVYGYKDIKKNDLSLSFTEDEVAFMQVKTLDELIVVWEKLKNTKLGECYSKKYVSTLSEFFNAHDDHPYRISAWMIKHAKPSDIKLLRQLLHDHECYKLTQVLHYKMLGNPQYEQHLIKTFGIYFARCKEIAALDALMWIIETIPNHERLLDYQRKLSSQDLLDDLEQGLPADDELLYVHDYLIRLQKVYSVFSRDLHYSSSIEEAATIQSRIAYVKGKYIVLMSSYMRFTALSAEIYGSELFYVVEIALSGKWKKLNLDESVLAQSASYHDTAQS